MSRIALAFAAALLGVVPLVQAGAEPLSVRENFRIGSGGSVLCTAQSLGNDKGLSTMFDRGYSVICRDATAPIGLIYALKTSAGDPADRLKALRVERANCQTATRGQIEGLGAVETIECTLKDVDVTYRVYEYRKGNILYSAEGLAGYDSALQLGLRSIIADKIIPGELSIATTGAGDAAAFARVQAGTLDASRALAEAYRRNNAGSYAESAEFFATVSKDEEGRTGKAEGLVNEALQKSNLGRYAEADALFGRAEELVDAEPLVARQLRNYRAMHLLNQGNPQAALEELDKPLPRAPDRREKINNLVIDAVTAARLNAEAPGFSQTRVRQFGSLPQEKAEILDGQALQLRGAALRLKGNLARGVGRACESG